MRNKQAPVKQNFVEILGSKRPGHLSGRSNEVFARPNEDLRSNHPNIMGTNQYKAMIACNRSAMNSNHHEVYFVYLGIMDVAVISSVLSLTWNQVDTVFAVIAFSLTGFVLRMALQTASRPHYG